MVENFNVGLFKEARLGSMVKNPKLGLGSGSTLEARAWLGLKNNGLVPSLVQPRDRKQEALLGCFVNEAGLLKS